MIYNICTGNVSVEPLSVCSVEDLQAGGDEYWVSRPNDKLECLERCDMHPHVLHLVMYLSNSYARCVTISH